MKRLQNNFTALIMLMVAAVILLGALAILAYQNQVEIQHLRAALAKPAASAPSSDGPMLESRLAAIEKRVGLNDPEVDKLKESLSKEQAEAKILAGRAATLGAAKPDATRKVRPPDLPAEPANGAPPETEEPTLADPAAAAGASPEANMAALPAVALMEKFDPFWYSGQINKGRRHGLQPKQQYALRRPSSGTIIAMIEVVDCQEETSAVGLVRGSLANEKFKPQAGDELFDHTKLVSPATLPAGQEASAVVP